MAVSLADLRASLAAWGRAGGEGPAVHPPGVPALDRLLPGGGHPRQGLVECLAADGAGARSLALRILRPALAAGPLLVFDRDRDFHPAALPASLAPAGTANFADRMIIVRPGDRRAEAWAIEQALRSPGVGAVLAWPDRVEERVFRRWRIAMEEGAGLGVFVRPLAAAAAPCWADIRWRIDPVSGGGGSNGNAPRLRVELLRCRHGRPGATALVEPDDGDSQTEPQTLPGGLASQLAAPAPLSRSA